MNTGYDVLLKARKLIAEPAQWTQKYGARNRQGYPVNCDDDDAVCWCALGAISKCTYSLDIAEDTIAALELTSARMFGRTVAGVNDHLGHAAILQVFDAALAKASPTPVSPAQEG